MQRRCRWRLSHCQDNGNELAVHLIRNVTLGYMLMRAELQGNVLTDD